MTKTKSRDLPLLDGDQPQFDQIVIKGVPHRLEAIRELEKLLGGKVVRDDTANACLDAILKSHYSKTKTYPERIEDEQTHERYIPVRVTIPGAVEGVPIVTFVYIKLPFMVITK